MHAQHTSTRPFIKYNQALDGLMYAAVHTQAADQGC